MQPHPWKVQPSLQMLSIWSKLLVKEKGGTGYKMCWFSGRIISYQVKKCAVVFLCLLKSPWYICKNDTFPFKYFLTSYKTMNTNTMHLGESSFKIKPITSLHWLYNWKSRTFEIILASFYYLLYKSREVILLVS